MFAQIRDIWRCLGFVHCWNHKDLQRLDFARFALDVLIDFLTLSFDNFPWVERFALTGTNTNVVCASDQIHCVNKRVSKEADVSLSSGAEI